MDTATFILETFIIPQEKRSKLKNNDLIGIQNKLTLGREIQSVVYPKPIARHFNSLIEGYCNIKRRRKQIPPTNMNSIENARLLFETMISIDVLPDAYTITLMMALPRI